MAVKSKLTKSIPVQLTPDWRDRVVAVSDHPLVEDSMAQVIRLCIEAALPSLELELGLVDLDENPPAGDGFQALDAADKALLVPREDRSKGCFGAG